MYMVITVITLYEDSHILNKLDRDVINNKTRKCIEENC